MIPPSTLPAPWIPVVVEETPGELVVTDAGRYNIRRYAVETEFPTIHFRAGENVAGHVEAIKRIDTDEPTTWIRRPTTTTRRWAKQPPNDTTRIACMYYTGDLTQWMGSLLQDPREGWIAWMLWSDWLAFLVAPRVVKVTAEDVQAQDVVDALGVSSWIGGAASVETLADRINDVRRRRTTRARAGSTPTQVVEVTAADVASAYTDANNGRHTLAAYDGAVADFINARLRARAPKPSLDWLTGALLWEQLLKSRNSPEDWVCPSWDDSDQKWRDMYDDAAARLRQIGEAQ